MGKRKSSGPKWDKIAEDVAKKAYKSAAPVIEEEAKKFGQWATPRAAEAAGKLKAHGILRSNYSRAAQQIDEAVDRLLADPIRAVNLRLTSDTTVEADQLHIKTEVFTGSFGIPGHTAKDIEVIPPVREGEDWSVEVLALFATTLYSLIAIRINNTGSERHLAFRLTGQSGEIANVLLRNATDGTEYLPLSTDLPGHIGPGQSVRGLIAFSKLILPADKLEFEITLEYRAKDFETIRLSFWIEAPAFDRQLEGVEADEGPDTLRSILHEALESKRSSMIPHIDKAARDLRQKMEGEGSGCVLTTVLLSGSVLLSAGLLLLL
jgi:hypothetical protein